LNDAASPRTLASTGSRRRLSWLRGTVRVACLALAVAALLSAPAWPRSPLGVAAASPLVAVASLLATRAIRAATLLGLLVGLIALARRRWFCHWVCPTGLCCDLAGRLGTRMGRPCRRLPKLGPWIVLVTLGGAAVGYPLLLWLDPLAIFSGLFSLNAGPTARWCALGVPVVVLLSLLAPGGWCGRLCPLGAMQDLLWRTPKAVRQVLSSTKPAAARTGFRLARRAVFGLALGAVWAATTRKLRAASPARLRPPGAIEPWNFSGVCIRCGNCTRACPARIITAELGEHGIAQLLTPIVHFREDYCREDCTRCMDVCPSGALRPLSAQEKILAPMGLPRVDMNRCLLGDDRECAICRNRCPFQAITLVFSQADYVLTPQVDPHKCSGCGACELSCPTLPIKAIVVRP
jgi:ferredoxin-type protein NapF